jgi:hypothetical protein
MRKDLFTDQPSPGFVATQGALKFAGDLGAPPEMLAAAAPIEVAVTDIFNHIRDTGKVEQPTTFWSAMGPRQVPF